MIDIEKVMRDLSRDRPIFHSEADFQHALAWLIHEKRPDCGVRLEYKIPDERIYLDLWLDQIGVAIELKYRTRQLVCAPDGESFALRNQSATDVSRYDFLKDIQRLENLSGLPHAKVGYAIFLTNEYLYWKKPVRPNTVDAKFRLQEGRTLRGEMAWSKKASEGTMKGRENPIQLKDSYQAEWRHYADVSGEGFGKFRYLVMQTTISGG